MIALLCPSRGRVENCQRMIESAYNTTTENIEVYIAVSSEEFQSYNAGLKSPGDRMYLSIIVRGDFQPTSYKWNRLAEIAKVKGNKFMMLAADDMVFETPGWDKALIENANGRPQVFHLQDSRDKDGTPHIIVTKEYMDVMGWFVPPYFKHWFIDSWTVEMAKHNDCFVHLRDYLLTHDKPSDYGVADETHSRIRDFGWHQVDSWTNDMLKTTVFGFDCQRLRSALNG